MTHRHLMALISIADTEATVSLLIEAVKGLVKWSRNSKEGKFEEQP